jgi:hypothetical protein
MICTTPVPPAHHDGGTASAISHYEWLAFDGDGSGYVPDFESMGFPSFLRGSSGPEDAGDTQDVFFDARPDPEDLQLNIPATEGRGGILSTNPVELESGLTASISSSELTVSSDSFWSPGSGSSALTSPSTAWESPYLSPDLLLGQSPLQGFPFSSSTSTSAEGVSQASGGPDSAIPSASWGTPCQFPDLFPGPSSLQGFTLGSPEDMSPYVASSWNRYEGGLGAPAAFPGQAGAQEPPLQVTTTKQSSALQDRPAGLSAYVPSPPPAFLMDIG